MIDDPFKSHVSQSGNDHIELRQSCRLNDRFAAGRELAN